MFDRKVVEDTDTPATLNLQEGSLLQAVLPVNQSNPDGQPAMRQPAEYLMLKFDRWDDDSAYMGFRVHPEQRLGPALICLFNGWRHELPPYTAICYSYNGYYLDLDDTAASLALPPIAQINTHLFDYLHFGDRDHFQKRIDDVPRL